MGRLRQHLSQSLLQGLGRSTSHLIRNDRRIHSLRRVDLLNRLCGSFNNSMVALLRHHLDLPFEPIMELDCFLTFYLS